MTNKNQPPAGGDKPARRKRTHEEQLAELDKKRKQLEQQADVVKARQMLESAVALLRDLNFDGAVERAQAACRVMQPHVTVDIDVEEYGDPAGAR